MGDIIVVLALYADFVQFYHSLVWVKSVEMYQNPKNILTVYFVNNFLYQTN